MAYTIDEIIRLMEQASRLGVSVKITQDGFSVKVDGISRPCEAVPQASVPQVTPAAPPAPEEAPQAQAAAPSGTVVKSPIVGTFYAAPAPDKEPFAAPGKQVKKGDVLFIIESMKLMNEVQSEHDGVVKEILVSNGQAVEYGQPILVLE